MNCTECGKWISDGDTTGTWKQYRCERCRQVDISRVPGLVKERDALKAEVERLRAFVGDVLAVANESRGIDGWHLNGDIAEWGEFEWYNAMQKAAP